MVSVFAHSVLLRGNLADAMVDSIAFCLGFFDIDRFRCIHLPEWHKVKFKSQVDVPEESTLDNIKNMADGRGKMRFLKSADLVMKNAQFIHRMRHSSPQAGSRKA